MVQLRVIERLHCGAEDRGGGIVGSASTDVDALVAFESFVMAAIRSDIEGDAPVFWIVGLDLSDGIEFWKKARGAHY